EVRDLDVEERKVSDRPLATPVLNEGAEDVIVERRAFEGAVALTLVPEHPANRERSQRSDHAVPQQPRTPAVEGAVPAELWNGLAGSLCLGGLASLILGFETLLRFAVGHLAARDEQRGERCIGAESSQPNPGIGDGAAPGGIDEADGNMFAI